jgi:Ca2+-binding RTX toxin-like protein
MSKFRICVFSVLLLTSFTVVSQLEGAVWADNDDENPNPQQLSGLCPCSIQEKNVQGRTIVGTILADICQGTDRSETVLGLQDNDILSGHGGDDIVEGNEGDDKIDGGGRNDVLIGGEGDDILSGEDGDDILYGVIGNDVMRGGPGANEFICGDEVDTVLDYKPSQGDVISNDCEIVNSQ